MSGNYITPLFNEKFEDKVWSVEVTWDGVRQQVFVYLLLEFQSTVDHRLPIRMLHYVACFYDHLIKTKVTTARKGMPPIFPVVLYNGSKRWTAREDILLKLGVLTDEQVAQSTGLSLAEVKALQSDQSH